MSGRTRWHDAPTWVLPLRFDVPVLRYSDEARRQEHRRLSADFRLVVSDRSYLNEQGRDAHVVAADARIQRLFMWELAGAALKMRRHDADSARLVLMLVRKAWEEICRGEHSSARSTLTGANAIANEASAVFWRKRDDKARQQRRAAARKHRSGPSDAELVAHRKAYIEAKGHDRGWQKCAFIELGIPERTLRARLKKMRQ